MAGYDLTPVDVPVVETKYRRIKTKLPVPESLPIFEALKKSEPQSMMGQPPIVWHKADNFIVSDAWGNQWIDWSSCVLVANAGHGRKEIKDALKATVDQGLLSTYVFVHEQRAELCTMLQALAPKPDNYQVFLLSTGSEATENCIKLSKTYALQKYGPSKKYFVSFERAFHGRTMGAQLAGGIEGLKTWMIDRDPTFIQVPFPDGYVTEDTSFDSFLKAIESKGVKPEEIAGVMFESYQGGGADFLPMEYAQKLEAFCRKYDILLTCDEVQAGFARTGKMFAFQHYGITPDLIPCGKGISSSLPISAVIGRIDVMGLYAPGSMTSTHSASPLPVAAAVANLKLIQSENLVERAAEMGAVLHKELARIGAKYPKQIGSVYGKGLVAGMRVVVPGTKDPDGETAHKINVACYQKGVLMFSPVGTGGACLKIAPPLTITEEALWESIKVFEEAVDEVLGK